MVALSVAVDGSYFTSQT